MLIILILSPSFPQLLGRPQEDSEQEDEVDEPPPVCSLFDPPSVGPKILQSLLSWISPITLNKAFSHRSVSQNDNYSSLLVEGGTAASFLSRALKILSRQWYPEMTDSKIEVCCITLLGAEKLSTPLDLTADHRSSLSVFSGRHSSSRCRTTLSPSHRPWYLGEAQNTGSDPAGPPARCDDRARRGGSEGRRCRRSASMDGHGIQVLV